MNMREALISAGLVKPRQKQEYVAPAAANDANVTVSKDHPHHIILTFSNGAWKICPHRWYFQNMLREHLKQITGYKNKQKEELSIRMQMEQGEVVRVNGCTFRFKHEKQAVQQEAAA